MWLCFSFSLEPRCSKDVSEDEEAPKTCPDLQGFHTRKRFFFLQIPGGR